MKLQIQNRTFVCQVNRTKRKTIQIKLLAPDQLQIAAPTRTTLSQLETMVLTKAEWIVKQAEKLEALSAATINSAVAEGAQVLYLGNPYTIVVKKATQPEVYCYNSVMAISCPLDDSRTAELILKDWYLTSAVTIFKEKTSFWAPRLGVTPQRITIKDQKTRWGSCSSTRTITYNWRVVMAPPAVLDYLVVHELSHMLVPNHSPKFWHLVETILPDYKIHRKWLKDNGRLLSRILQ